MVTIAFVFGLISIIYISFVAIFLCFIPSQILYILPFTISLGIYYLFVILFWLIPMAYTIPMVVHVYKAKNGEAYLTIPFKVCYLIFISVVGGILLLIDSEI